MNRFLKKISVVLAVAVAVSAVPMDVFAASCTVHDPVKDAGGSVVFYVDADEHYNFCNECCKEVNRAPHVNNGSDECTGCGVTLDSGTATHTHNCTPGNYGLLNQFGHTLVCSDSKCVGLFGTHTTIPGPNCVDCGWSGPVIGAGSGNIEWEYDFQGGPQFLVPENGQKTIGVATEDVPTGYELDILIGYVDTTQSSHKFVPYSTQSGVSFVSDGDGTYTVTFDGAALKAAYPSDYSNGYFHVAAVMKDTTANDKIVQSNGFDAHWDIQSNPGGGCSHQYDNKLFGVEPDGHYPVCDLCGANGMKTTHIDDENGGDGRCDICKATVTKDAATNMYIHTHISDGTSFSNDVNDHGTVCNDCGSGYWEAHSDAVNNNDGSANPDGICDICGRCAQHVQKVDSDGKFVFEIGPAGHKRICANCNEGYDGAVHADGDNDGDCDTCGFSIGCNHSTAGRWWDTQETEHTLHCTCGYPVAPAANHADADADGLCDDCGVGVDAQLEHTHNWDMTQWFANNDNTEHFRNCTDPACTRSTNPHAAADSNGDNVCDNCNLSMGSQGGQGGTTPPSCQHTPRQNGDGSYVYVVEEEEHLNVCDNCNTTYTGTAHDDTDSDNRCDECHAPVSLTNGKYIHTHHFMPGGPFAVAYSHYDKCDTCGNEVNETQHTDSDTDGFCDGCGTDVVVNSYGNFEHQCGNTKPVAMDTESHAEVCSRCVQKNNWENHADILDNTDPTNQTPDGKCDKCDATVDSNGKHIHQPDGNWSPMDGMEHTCECTECEEWVNETHFEDPNNADGICDACGYGTPLCSHTAGNFWWDTNESDHGRYCGDCGNYVDLQGNHEDNDNNGKCDQCNVGVDSEMKHTHNWDMTQWFTNNDNTVHFRNCTDSECTKSTSSAFHCDTDADNECDVCGTAYVAGSNWCTGHTSNGDMEVDKNNHYSICADCGNTFDGAAHTARPDAYRTDENNKYVHYEICDICEASIGNGEAHVKSEEAGYHAEADKHYDVCEICHEPYGAGYAHVRNDQGSCEVCGMPDIDTNGIHSHTESQNWFAERHEHYTNCTSCGMGMNSELHNDADNNGKCDGCGASVTKNADGEWEHTHTAGTDTIIGYEEHAILCECGEQIRTVPHIDADEDEVCDDCGTQLEINDEGNLVHVHIADGNWKDGDDGSSHYCGCTECDSEDAAREDHVDNGMDYECDICEGYVEHHGSGGFGKMVLNGAEGHAEICGHCENLMPETFAPHEESDEWVCSSETKHSKVCHICGEFVSTEGNHADTDGDASCDECGVSVDANGKHTHIAGFWSIDEESHVRRCDNCGLMMGTDVPHTDADGNGRCDGCNATVDENNIHNHTMKNVYVNNTAHAEKCENCDAYFGQTSHFDDDDNGICDDCNKSFVVVNVDLEQAQKTSLKAKLDAALEKAINSNDYSELKAFISDDNDCRIFAEAYAETKANESNTSAEFVIYTEVVLESENGSDPDVKPFFDNAKAAVKGGTLSRLFAMYIETAIVSDESIGVMHAGNMYSQGALKYVIEIDAEDVKSNRVWYVYATEGGTSYTKVGESAKGASEVVFENDNPNYAFALIYKDVSSSSSSSSDKQEATPTPTPTPTTAPAVTPAPSAEPTPAPTEEPVEMPENADTTIAGAQASEEVVEIAKENVTVTEGVATVDKATVEAIVEASKEETTVVIPLTETVSGTEVVNKAEISTEALEAVADSEKDVVIQLTDATVKLDAKALKAITEQADGETIEIRVVKTEPQTLTDAQQKKIKEMDTAIVVSAQIFSDGEYIGEFKGGNATIMIPFEPEEGREAKDYSVYYINEKGELEKVAAEYVDGNMVFTTAHFSEYVIVYEGAQTAPVVPEVPAETPAASMPIIPIVAAIAIILVAGVVIISRKKREE